MIIGRSSTRCVFYADRKSKMAATAIHRLTLDPMGKCSNAFFSETTNMIRAKLYMNVHWMVLYKLYVFCSDMKFKMAATARLSLTLDPMGKIFQNASSLKPLGQLKPNCPGMIIGRSSVFYADRKSKMATTTGHSINTGPYGGNTEIYSSLKLLHWLNLNCASIIGRSFTKFVFFMLIVIPRWLPLQDIVFT